MTQTYGATAIQVDEDYLDLTNVTCPTGPGSATASPSATATATAFASASPPTGGADRADPLLCNGFPAF